MTNQQGKPVSATEVDVQSVLAEAQKTGNLSEAKFMALLSIMMAKEARLAEKEASLEVALKARDDQRKKESENFTISKIENQKACKHLKGGKGRTRGQQRDPAVFGHTFTDGTIVIKCQLCQARWLPGDTDEYLTRNGSKIPNWTGIGWRRAQEMAEDSSNKPSSSERFSGEHFVSAESKKAGKELMNTPNLQL
jgi:hypothetical protein